MPIVEVGDGRAVHQRGAVYAQEPERHQHVLITLQCARRNEATTIGRVQLGVIVVGGWRGPGCG